MENDFGCTTAEAAKARAVHKVPVWRYVFANNKPGADKGATHGDEVAFLFGDGKEPLSKLFQSAWIAFAEDSVNGLSQLGWPIYQPDC